jgi:hypothetical protein
MPIFDDDDQESFNATGAGFGFSGVKADTLGATKYTLVGLVADRSGSVSGLERDIEACIKSSLQGCQKSAYVDNLLVRYLGFDSDREELHGFRPLSDCHLGNYDGSLKIGGATVLYDASVDMIDSLATYGKYLQDQEYTANAIVVILTDGMDQGSTLSVNEVKAAVARARQGETLESIRTILIGFNVQNPRISQFLNEFKTKAEIDQYIECQDATPDTFSRIAGFISQSVSSQSQAVGSGGPSQAITF